jgi:hypothetical protein|tara:strand:- start:6784 stop:7215 length:432 start_codon:yes stop_codon:yes gene_type:complete
MLIQLKNKQRNIASVTLSLFLGSWLLLLCQTCMALVDDVNNLIDSVAEVSDCHTTENDNAIDEIVVENEEHCLGVCDCDDLSVTTNSEKNHDLKNKIKFSQDLYAFDNPLVYQADYDLPDKLISTQPERAILLPFKRFTVLLN